MINLYDVHNFVSNISPEYFPVNDIMPGSAVGEFNNDSGMPDFLTYCINDRNMVPFFGFTGSQVFHARTLVKAMKFARQCALHWGASLSSSELERWEKLRFHGCNGATHPAALAYAGAQLLDQDWKHNVLPQSGLMNKPDTVWDDGSLCKALVTLGEYLGWRAWDSDKREGWLAKQVFEPWFWVSYWGEPRVNTFVNVLYGLGDLGFDAYDLARMSQGVEDVRFEVSKLPIWGKTVWDPWDVRAAAAVVTISAKLYILQEASKHMAKDPQYDCWSDAMFEYLKPPFGYEDFHEDVTWFTNSGHVTEMWPGYWPREFMNGSDDD